MTNINIYTNIIIFFCVSNHVFSFVSGSLDIQKLLRRFLFQAEQMGAFFIATSVGEPSGGWIRLPRLLATTIWAPRVPSLKLTACTWNGWLEYDHFLLGWPIFRGKLLVSVSVYISNQVGYKSGSINQGIRSYIYLHL